MKRVLLLAAGPFIMGASLLHGCATGMASGAELADPSAYAAAPASTPLNAPMPTVDYLLSLGPYGALVWGAFLLGKGVKVTVQVELSERDRNLAEDFVRAIEKEHS